MHEGGGEEWKREKFSTTADAQKKFLSTNSCSFIFIVFIAFK
jgi:hypothetical protein